MKGDIFDEIEFKKASVLRQVLIKTFISFALKVGWLSTWKRSKCLSSEWARRSSTCPETVITEKEKRMKPKHRRENHCKFVWKYFFSGIRLDRTLVPLRAENIKQRKQLAFPSFSKKSKKRPSDAYDTFTSGERRRKPTVTISTFFPILKKQRGRSQICFHVCPFTKLCKFLLWKCWNKNFEKFCYSFIFNRDVVVSCCCFFKMADQKSRNFTLNEGGMMTTQALNLPNGTIIVTKSKKR